VPVPQAAAPQGATPPAAPETPVPAATSPPDATPPPAQPAAADSLPPPAPAAAVKASRVPDTLGTLTLRRNETISGLIQRIYGNYSARNFRAIILANPQIDDPDRVEAGQIVQIPALAVAVKPPAGKNFWWVRIAEKPSLQEAFDFLRNYPESAPAARMVPCWNPKSGLRFVLLLRQVFSDPETARLQLKLLPPPLAGGEVVNVWAEQTAFFADPWYGVK